MAWTRQLSLVSLYAFVVAWALCLSIVGLWLLFNPPIDLVPARHVLRSGGLASLAAGQLLFMLMVLDRCFPDAHPRVVWALEMLGIMTLTSGLLAFLYLFLAGATPA